MKKRNYLTVIFILVFILFLSYLYSAGPNTITYQGTVTTAGGGTPPDGNYAMLFSLWNLKSGGDSATNRLWYETYVNANAVTVTKGTFSVELGSITTFPIMLFRSNPNLWLQVSVDLTGVTGSGLQVYSPRVTFSATPYAFHSDNAHTLDGFGLGAFAMLDSVNMFAASPTDSSYTGAPIRIYPELGFNPNDPLFSIYTSPNHMVLVREPGNLTVSDVIQAGTILAPVAYNRLGAGTATQAAIANNNDLLINGDLEVKGSIYYGTKTDYISISPSAFNPGSNTYTYYMGSYYLSKSYGYTTTQNWYAPVYLPDGAVVTEFKVWYFDYTSQADMTFRLQRATIASSGVDMASVATSGNAGNGVGTDTSINYATVNNGSYVYYLFMQFPAVDIGDYLSFSGARIKYTTTGP